MPPVTAKKPLSSMAGRKDRVREHWRFQAHLADKLCGGIDMCTSVLKKFHFALPRHL